MSRELHVESGTLLAAWPDLMDPNFMHSVVVVCQHSSEGAYGLVTNRKTELKVLDLLPDHAVLGSCALPVHLGGPVEQQTLQFLHSVPKEIPGGLCIDGQLWLGGELEALGRFAAKDFERATRSVRLFVGYSGWGAGQLEEELDRGSWLPAPPSPAFIFEGDGEATWRQVVRSIEGVGDELGDLPPDLSWN